MMKTVNIGKWLLLISFFLISAETIYRPSGTLGGFSYGGYSDQRLNANTQIVRYNASDDTSLETVKNYLLYRCAEVTVENGYNYFIVVSSSLSSLNMHIKTRKTYNNNTTTPPKLYDTFSQQETYQSYAVSQTPTEPNCRKGNCDQPYQHSAVAVIKMFEGLAPAHVPNAYNAEDVLAHLGPETF